MQQLKYEVLIQQAISHHPFIVTSHEHWQNKGSVYQRKFMLNSYKCVMITFLIIFVVTEFISEGEIFQKIKNFTQKLIQFYVAELAIVIGKSDG